MKNLKLDGFLGIEFGCSIQITKEKFTNKTGITLELIEEGGDTLFCNNFNFAGRETELLLLMFLDNKFCKGVVYVKPKLESQVVDLFKQIKNEINTKYYTSNSEYEFYTEPYEKDDGYTESAISLGKADFSCFWNFGNTEKESNTISLMINENLEIVIAYENDNLMKQLVEKNQKQNSLDY